MLISVNKDPALSRGPQPGADPESASDDPFTIRAVAEILLRNRWTIALATVITVAVALAYLLFATPLFTATASILIDPRQQGIVSESPLQSLGIRENLVVDSEIEIIKSTGLLSRVVKRVKLDADPEYVGPPGIVEIVRQVAVDLLTLSFLREKEIERPVDQTGLLATELRERLDASRVDLTFAIDISYYSDRPHRAAKVANAIAEEYLTDQLESQYESTRRANDWLKDRLRRLQAEVIEAERAVELYKAENDIVSLSTGLVSDEQLSQLSSQLIVARAETAKAKARYDRIQIIVDENDATSAVNDALSNQLITDLRREYSDASRQASDIQRRYGADHLAYKKIVRQLADIEVLIIEELKRIAKSYKSDYEIAKSREQSLEGDLQSQKAAAVFSSQTQIKLRELERRATSSKNLYTRLLDKYNELTERQTSPITGARIISRAQVPTKASSPNKKLTLALALVLGLGIGVGIAFMREQFDNYVWTAEDVETVTSYSCLGLLPDLNLERRLNRATRKGRKLRARLKGRRDREAIETQSYDLNVLKVVTETLADSGSDVSEVMRGLRLATNITKTDRAGGRGQVLSFVSARPGEGKSLLSCLFATYLAKLGENVLLIDCDFRRPRLTTMLAPDTDAGLYEFIASLEDKTAEEDDAEGPRLTDLFQRGFDGYPNFIPARNANCQAINLDHLLGKAVSDLLLRLRENFDTIIIDLPPILNMVDARILAHAIDTFVLTVEWGKTDKDTIMASLRKCPEIHEKMIGSIINRVDFKKAVSYGYYGYRKGYQAERYSYRDY